MTYKPPKGHKRNLSKSLLGHEVTKETREKISKARKEKPIRYWLGKKRPKFSIKTRRKMSEVHKGNKNPSKRPEVREKISKSLMGHKGLGGKNNPNWKGGKSFELYSIDWTETLRRSTRERDNYVCCLCGKQQGDIAHDVHHIDFDKKNNNPTNLITICHKCHLKTSQNRKYWIKYSQFKILK